MQNTTQDSWDPVWDRVFSENAWGKYPAENLIRFVARNFYRAKRAEVRILEVGCGTGANLWYCSREGFDAYGIDGSAIAIEQAAERMRMEGCRATLRVGDIVNLPYAPEMFDAVLDVECVYCNNIQNTRRIFKEISRVLKPKGKFFSRTFSDQQFIGSDYEVLGPNEYTKIKEGPLAGKGFVRLTSVEGAHSLYGESFDLISVDRQDLTLNNRTEVISELIVVAEKRAV